MRACLKKPVPISPSELLRIDQTCRHIVTVSDSREGRLEQFVLGITQDITQGAIDLQIAAVPRHECHPGRSIIKGAAKSLLAGL